MTSSETFWKLMMVLWWCGVYFRDACFKGHVTKPSEIVSSVCQSSQDLLLWFRCRCSCVLFIRAAHRSPPAHRDAGSAPKAQRDWRNMKYLTQPVLAVTYWGREGCLSMPEIDFVLEDPETLRWRTQLALVVRNRAIDWRLQCLCWVRRCVNYPASLRCMRLRWTAVFRCVCVCTVITAVFSKQEAVLLSVVTPLCSDASSGLCESVNCELSPCAERLKVTAWTSACLLRHTESRRRPSRNSSQLSLP